MLANKIIEVSDADFEQQVLNAPLPVLVDYWAEWCGPCKLLPPVLETLAEEYAGRLKIVKLNVDYNPITPKQYGVRGIPTLMLFKQNKVIATKVGALPKSQLYAFINNYL